MKWKREPLEGVLVKQFAITICRDCYELIGEQCNNAACVFCRRSMKEVGEFLDALLIRPVVDGERLRL